MQTARNLKQVPGMQYAVVGLVLLAISIDALSMTESFDLVDAATDAWNAVGEWFSSTTSPRWQEPPGFDSPEWPEYAEWYNTTTACDGSTTPYLESYRVISQSELAATTVAASNVGDRIKDFEANPGNWERTGVEEEPAKGDYKGGTSVRERFKNKLTGKELERHRIYGKSGKIRHEHWAGEE